LEDKWLDNQTPLFGKRDDSFSPVTMTSTPDTNTLDLDIIGNMVNFIQKKLGFKESELMDQL
jgi:hypothetical protein